MARTQHMRPSPPERSRERSRKPRRSRPGAVLSSIVAGIAAVALLKQMSRVWKDTRSRRNQSSWQG